jgi:hypothetical protein
MVLLRKERSARQVPTRTLGKSILSKFSQIAIWSVAKDRQARSNLDSENIFFIILSGGEGNSFSCVKFRLKPRLKIKFLSSLKVGYCGVGG